MWIKFTSDEELEGKGFQAKYSFIPGENLSIILLGLTEIDRNNDKLIVQPTAS